MSKTSAMHGAATALVGLALALATPLSAQEGWSWDNSTEVGLVSTAGNAENTTFSLKSTLTGTGGPNTFKFGVGGVRASSTVTTRTAVGTPGSFTLVETDNTVESAANYFARGRYDRDLGEAFGFGGAGWERNTFAGFANRWSGVAGIGRTWVESDRTTFKTDIGGTYTVQEDLEGESDGFGGLRTTIEWARTLSESTDFETTFVVDENLADTDDLRFDWLTSISVSLTEGLAFQTSYQLIFDNVPSLVSVPLFDGGGTEIGTVRVPSEEFDSQITLSLVIKL